MRIGEWNEGNVENYGGNGIWGENASAGNLRGNAGNLSRNVKIVENQGGDAENQGENLSIAVEMTQKSNENDKFKEWREEKMSTFVKA